LEFRRVLFRSDRAVEVAGEHGVVLEGQVDDAVGRSGGCGEAAEIVEVASVRLGAGSRQSGGGLVRAGQADDLVSRCEEFGDEGGADVSGGSGDEYAHGLRLPALAPVRGPTRCQLLTSL